ncbi:unnamed protein product [Danaus chrysippus]|uniref:(African queen) hypothetical protein n=1 Tax=Danaus chrysippus TaxID=151541 RepID=A0A8J2R3K4_9NEOP|nr:unnamed protein product [Danaus chrysippus]
MTLTNSEYFLDFLKENIMNGDIPEIYVDEEILKTAQTHSVHNNKVYNINGEEFTEKNDVDELKEFSIEYNNEEEDFPINLIVRDEKVLINSSILLHRNQWNAITDDKCHVCNMAVQDVYGHITSAKHKFNLDSCKPLKIFELHIIRRIGDNYHCGICNTLYNAREHNNHMDSMMHLENMLYATNRAVDVTNDIDATDVTSDSVSCDTNTVCETESGFNSENTDLYDTDLVNDNVRSYASVLRSSKNKSPQYIDFVCENSNWKIPFNTYHMLNKINKQYYCTICMEFFDLRAKIDHCASTVHLDKLKTCEANNKDGHLIRRVQQNAHCAICNVVVNGTEVHSHIVNQNHITRLNNSIIHPYPHTYYANMRIPVNNMPVMPLPIGINRMPTPLPIGINRMPINMPVYHHTTNNMNVNIYQTVNAENANISVKKDESKIEELKVDNIENKENESTLSISMRNRNDTIETDMSTENILDINTDETKTDDDDDKHTSNNKMEDKEYELKLLNEILYIRNRNDAIAMSQMTYNSLIHSGDGKIYCFVCDTKIMLTIEGHVESKQHVDRIKDSKFIAEYENDLLRQVIDGKLNCVTCNINFPNTPTNIKEHGTGKKHKENYSSAMEDAFTIV